MTSSHRNQTGVGCGIPLASTVVSQIKRRYAADERPVHQMMLLGSEVEKS